jgi:hypothetical protein
VNITRNDVAGVTSSVRVRDTPGMTQRFAPAVTAYSRRWVAELGASMTVSSPLGAWLLIAALTDADGGGHLADELGLSADEAREVVAFTLSDPHPALGVAMAAWARPDLLNERWDAWTARLATGVEVGPLPDKAQADTWAREHTLGLIKTFPIAIEPATALILASALACDVTWTQPYDTTTASTLGGQFGERVTSVLVGDGADVVVTRAAGEVAVHQRRSSSGLVVTSVLGPPDADAGTVQAAALEVVEAGVATHPGHRPLDSLPPSDDGTWSLTVRDGSVDRQTSIIPAWKARVDGAVIEAAPGVGPALDVARGMLRQPGPSEARQSAVAEYHQTGFRAAALTAFAVATGAMISTRPVRELTVRFNRPYAVVASTSALGAEPQQPWRPAQVADDAWEGVPVFLAWVTEPVEAVIDDA